MPGIALLVFREVLEAALIITIVCAATRGVPRRGLFVGGGLILGVLGALLVALFAGALANAFSGVGQEVFNAGVLLQKPRAYAEVYNDMDDDVVNFFTVLRDPVQPSYDAWRRWWCCWPPYS